MKTFIAPSLLFASLIAVIAIVNSPEQTFSQTEGQEKPAEKTTEEKTAEKMVEKTEPKEILKPKISDIIPKADLEEEKIPYPQPSLLVLDPPDKEYKAYQRPLDIAQIVYDFIKKEIPEGDRGFYRSVWIPDGETINLQLNTLIMNLTISRSSNFTKPIILADGQVLLYDFRFFGGQDSKKNIPEILNIWEEFENEPQYHSTTEIEVEIENKKSQSQGSTAKKSAASTEDNSLVPADSSSSSSTVKERNAKQKVEIAEHAANSDVVKGLVEMMKTNAPIVRHEIVNLRLMSTVDIGIGRGLYYDSVEIKTVAGKNDFEEFLKIRGISLQDVRNKNIKDVEFVTKSNVTGGLRKIFIVTGSGLRQSLTGNPVMWTEDLGLSQTKIANDGFRNVRNAKSKAIEAIAWKANGMPVYALFEFVNGTRQDAAPADVVADHTIPIGHGMELQGAMSCFICHGDEQGWKSFSVDFSSVLLAGGKPQVQLLDDVKNAKENQLDVIEEITAQLGNNIKKPLRRAREDFAYSVFLCCGQKIQPLAQQLKKIRQDYIYTLVDTKKALQELGYTVKDKKEAIEKFNELLKKVPPDPATGISPEDIIIAMLKEDRPVQRWQFNTIFSDMMLRAIAVDTGMAIPAKKAAGAKVKEGSGKKIGELLPSKM